MNELRANMVRVDADFSATPFKAKIADAEQQRVHTMLVGGGRDMEAGAVSVRLHHSGPQGAKPKGAVVADIIWRASRIGGCEIHARFLDFFDGNDPSADAKKYFLSVISPRLGS